MLPVLVTRLAAGVGLLAWRIGLRFAHTAGLPLLASAMSSARRRAAGRRVGAALSLALLLLAGFHGCRWLHLLGGVAASAAVVFAARWLPLRCLCIPWESATLTRRGLRGVSTGLALGVNEKTGSSHRRRMFRSTLRKSAAASRGSRWHPLSHGRGGCIGWVSRSRSASSSARLAFLAVVLRGLGMVDAPGGAGRSLPARATS